MKKNNWPLIILVSLFSAGFALLFAPKSGKELRKDLQNKANETKRRAGNHGNGVRLRHGQKRVRGRH